MTPMSRLYRLFFGNKSPMANLNKADELLTQAQTILSQAASNAKEQADCPRTWIDYANALTGLTKAKLDYNKAVANYARAQQKKAT